MNNILKLFLSFLLMVCLLDMPFFYYQFVRFTSMVIFVFFAKSSYKQKKENEVLIYISLAILFQPFIKVALGRLIWNIVDLIVGIGLILSLIQRNEKSK